MTRLHAALLLVLIASSLYLVKVSYDARRLFTALDRSQAVALQLESDHERLQLEARAQATPLRVERVARERLAMRNVSPAVTEYVSAAATTASAASGPSRDQPPPVAQPARTPAAHGSGPSAASQGRP